MAARPARFVLVARPYYTSGPVRHYLDADRAHDFYPVAGDIVEQDAGEPLVDDEGDRAVRFNGYAFDIADEVLVSVDKLIADRDVEPLADWERELLDAGTSETFHEVTLDRKVIRPRALADVLRAHGMSAETAEVLTALAVLRSIS